jgi:hypothetical protein
MLTPAMNKTLQEWDDVKKQISALTEAEKVLRDKIVSGVFNAEHEGTQTVPIAATWDLKCTVPFNRTIATEAFDRVYSSADAARKVLLDTIIVEKPQLVIAEYRKLSKEELAFCSAFITEKPGSPRLEIKQKTRT